jgi:hypothetical protein
MPEHIHPTANALLYFRIESVHRITRARYPFEISRAKNKKWKSPTNLTVPAQTISIVGRCLPNCSDELKAEVFGAIVANYSAVYQHDLSENFEYELIAEKIVWDNNDGEHHEYIFNQP